MLKNFSKIAFIVGKKNSLILLTLIPIGFLSIILELLSVASFLPLMKQVFGSDNISTSSGGTLANFSTILISYFDNVNYLFIFVLSVMILKNIYIIAQNYIFLIASKNIYLTVCEKLFLSKISESYTTFVKKSSSIFLKDLRETTVMFRLYIETIINFSIEISVSIIIIVFLLVMNFKVTVIIFFTLALFAYLFLSLSKNFSKRAGKKQNECAGQINNVLLNTYHNFIDIKLYREGGVFQRVFSEINSAFANYTKKLYFIYTLPKSVLELVIIFLLISFFIKNQGINLQDYIAIFGMYLIAIYRLLPSAAKLINLKIQMSAFSFTIEAICELIKKKRINKKPIKKIKSSIAFKNVSFSYDKKNVVIKNLNLTFKKNKIACIYGKSGCGKTTLVRLITGLIEPNVNGKILLDNKINYKNLSLDIGYVSQNFFIMKDTLANNIVFNGNKEDVDIKKLDNILHMLELDIVMKNKNLNYDSILTEDASLFSGGQRQRIAIARALYRDTDILILDESTNALDLKTEAKIIKNLHQIKKNKIIIIISHRKETKVACDISYDLS